MLRNAIKRIAAGCIEIRRGSPVDYDLATLIRVTFPEILRNVLANATRIMANVSIWSRISEYWKLPDIVGPDLEPPWPRVLTVTITDSRMQTEGYSYFAVKYFLNARVDKLFLTLVFCEPVEPETSMSVRDKARYFWYHFQMNSLVPESWLGSDSMPTLDPDAGERIAEDHVVFFKEYSVADLSNEDVLSIDLIEFTHFMFRAMDIETREGNDDQLEPNFPQISANDLTMYAFDSKPQIFRKITGASASAKPQTPHVKVWYGTNRKPAQDNVGTLIGYSDERGQVVNYGTCTVSIPEFHKFGSVGSNWLKRWLGRYDDRLKVEHVFAFRSAEEFIRDIQQNVNSEDLFERQILVYIHGYNVTFADAAIRAAQIGYDLGSPTTAFFSWPSQGTLQGYFADAASIDASEPYLVTFLKAIVEATRADCVNLVVHSMGNRAMVRAVHRIVNETSDSTVKFGQVFLAAPDVDVDVFQELAKIYPQVSKKTTLYVSAKDKAVEASHWLHNFDRVGFCPPTTILPGIDTIEVTDVDLSILGHGYISSAHAVLTDMFVILLKNSPPAERLRLKKQSTTEGETYWRLSE